MLGTTDVPIGAAFAIIVGSFVALFVLAMVLLHRGTGIRH